MTWICAEEDSLINLGRFDEIGVRGARICGWRYARKDGAQDFKAILIECETEEEATRKFEEIKALLTDEIGCGP